jgi:hypothetical protein
MQTNPTTNRRGRIFLVCLVGAGIATGALTAYFVHHAGRGLFATLFTAIYCGILGAGAAFLFLLAGFRIIWFIRCARSTRK